MMDLPEDLLPDLVSVGRAGQIRGAHGAQGGRRDQFGELFVPARGSGGLGDDRGDHVPRHLRCLRSAPIRSGGLVDQSDRRVPHCTRHIPSGRRDAGDHSAHGGTGGVPQFSTGFDNSFDGPVHRRHRRIGAVHPHRSGADDGSLHGVLAGGSHVG